jgi:predicted flavoprotein YhiN
VVHVDLHPDLAAAAIADRLARRRPKDSMATALRRTLGLSPVAVGLLREAVGQQLPADSEALASLIKAVPLVVDGVMPLERAISSAGGIALAEVDPTFMLRRVPGVFVAGEMLDWDAPTGGYLLQASFSTAVAAAQGAADWVSRRSSRPCPSSRA